MMTCVTFLVTTILFLNEKECAFRPWSVTSILRSNELILRWLCVLQGCSCCDACQIVNEKVALL